MNNNIIAAIKTKPVDIFAAIFLISIGIALSLVQTKPFWTTVGSVSAALGGVLLS